MNINIKNISEKDDALRPPKIGDIIEGKIVGFGSPGLFVDLNAFGAGIIYKKEFDKTKHSYYNIDAGSKDSLKNFKKGDKIFAKIIKLENEDGYFELSLDEAREELAWRKLEEIKEKDGIIEVEVSKVNKGGLIAEMAGVSGFLPLSQLSLAHYPRVEGGDSRKIVQELQKLIGKTLEVKIFNLEPRQKKLILSEKAKEAQNLREILKNCKVNDMVKGEITGITDFGIFVKFPSFAKNSVETQVASTKAKIPSGETSDQGLEKEDSKKENSVQLEGLIHISEIEKNKVNDLPKTFKMGQKIKAKIIKIAEDKVYLSLKNLEEKSPKKKPALDKESI